MLNYFVIAGLVGVKDCSMYKIWTKPVHQKFGGFLSTRLKYLYNQRRRRRRKIPSPSEMKGEKKKIFWAWFWLFRRQHFSPKPYPTTSMSADPHSSASGKCWKAKPHTFVFQITPGSTCRAWCLRAFLMPTNLLFNLEGFGLDLGWICLCVEWKISAIYLWCLEGMGSGTYKRRSWEWVLWRDLVLGV